MKLYQIVIIIFLIMAVIGIAFAIAMCFVATRKTDLMYCVFAMLSLCFSMGLCLCAKVILTLNQ